MILYEHWLLYVFKNRDLIVDVNFFSFIIDEKIDIVMILFCSVNLNYLPDDPRMLTKTLQYDKIIF